MENAIGKDKSKLQKEALREENRRIRAFRFLTDLTCQRLYLEDMAPDDAILAVDELRRLSERFFPGKAGTFDIVVAPRLYRIIRERYGIEVLSGPRH